MRRVALAAIRGYQRWLSPYKGYRCTLCAVTGAESCSNYGFRVIERFGLRCGLGLLERRLELCGHVHRSALAPAVSAPPPKPAVRNPWRHKEQGVCDLPCDSPGCDVPDLHCHGGRACSAAGDLLDMASCGCDIADCGDSARRRSRSCRDRFGSGRQQRDSAHLDALAQRIAERKRRRPS